MDILKLIFNHQDPEPVSHAKNEENYYVISFYALGVLSLGLILYQIYSHYAHCKPAFYQKFTITLPTTKGGALAPGSDKQASKEIEAFSVEKNEESKDDRYECEIEFGEKVVNLTAQWNNEVGRKRAFTTLKHYSGII